MYQYLDGLSFSEKRNILLELLLKNIAIGDRDRSQMHLEKMMQILKEDSEESFVEIQMFSYELNVLLRHLCHMHKVNVRYSEEVYKNYISQIRNQIYPIHIIQLLYDMVEAYMKLIQIHARRQYSDLIRFCLDYVDFHFSEPITLASVAHSFSVSECYLSARFTKETNMNFITYVNKVRVDYACVLLEKFQMPIQKVAELSGFASSSYFTRVFKHQIGMSPSQYRKQKHSKLDIKNKLSE